MQITVLVSFTRSGEILGKPRITFESPEAGRDDSLAYRVAVMEALQRCTPLPFTPSMGAPSPDVRSRCGSMIADRVPNQPRREHG